MRIVFARREAITRAHVTADAYPDLLAYWSDIASWEPVLALCGARPDEHDRAWGIAPKSGEYFYRYGWGICLDCVLGLLERADDDARAPRAGLA